jgi:hypothetical protein
VEGNSLSEIIRKLSTNLIGIVSKVDVDALQRPEREAVQAIRRLLVDVRLDVRDYELAETRAEQLELGKVAQKRLEELHDHILKTSEYNILSSVDVAQNTAYVQYIISKTQ